MRIAAFDSGIGGLSAIAPLFHDHPDLDVTYLGDLANLPYGTKSPERIKWLTVKNLEWLLDRALGEGPLDHLLIACNTASSHAIQEAQAVGRLRSVPVTGVLEPGCRLCLSSSPERVLVLATSSTVASQSYARKIRELGFRGELIQKACPLFVPLVEDNLLGGPAVEEIIRRYLDELSPGPGDAVILGCTHYPFLMNAFAKIYPEVKWVEAGQALRFEPAFKEKPASGTAKPKLRLMFTDSTASLEAVNRLLQALDLTHVEVTSDSIGPVV